ncbi:hypothetical protein ACZ90_49185 [Streptomyces albus subsp. albus]|nr:hypothetical protein ACZ90_49185 [Streptomyces albus subsp. albus]
MTDNARRGGGQYPADSFEHPDPAGRTGPVPSGPYAPGRQPYPPQQPMPMPMAAGAPGGPGEPGEPGVPGVPGGLFGQPGHRGPRARGRRPAALLVAVAVVSAVFGGGTAALVGQAAEHHGSSAPAAVVNASTGDKPAGGSVAAVAKAVSPSIVEIQADTAGGRSTGSGVVITGDGEIVTNNHVIAGADSIEVRFSDGTRKSASVVGTDPAKDLALIKVRGASGLKTAVLGDSGSVQVGDQVVAIGSPEGLTGTVTSGIVSALDRDVTVSTDESQGQRGGSGSWPFEFGGGRYNGDVGPSTTTYKAIQTDASLNPGNSGGALINMRGQVIGINSAMYAADSGRSSGSAGSVGLGFSIPVNTVKADLAALRGGSGV